MVRPLEARARGRRVEDIIGAAAYQKVGPYIERAFAGDTVTYVGEVPYLDHQSRFIEATYLPQLDENKRVAGLVALISDVSERKAFERFRAAAALRAERLVKITTAVADAVTTDEVLGAVVDNVAAALDASSAALWLVEEDGRTVKLARAVGYKESASEGFNHLSLDSDRSIPAIDAIRRAEPVWIPSQEALLRDYPHLGRRSLRAARIGFLVSRSYRTADARRARPHDRRAPRGNGR